MPHLLDNIFLVIHQSEFVNCLSYARVPSAKAFIPSKLLSPGGFFPVGNDTTFSTAPVLAFTLYKYWPCETAMLPSAGKFVAPGISQLPVTLLLARGVLQSSFREPDCILAMTAPGNAKLPPPP